MKQNSKFTAIELDVNMVQFLDWFTSEYNGSNYGFNFQDFACACADFYNGASRGSISFIGMPISSAKSGAYAERYTGYGILMSCYEQEQELYITERIKEYDSVDGVKKLLYTYQLDLNCCNTTISFLFYTDNRNPEFAWINTVGEWFKAAEKPVLCLESKTDLTRRAMEEIAGAITDGYYCDKGELNLCDFDNILEIREEWMRYKTRCSLEYFYDQCESGAGDLCDTAIIKALNWFRVGYETGALRLMDDISCPVLNKLGFKYKMY